MQPAFTTFSSRNQNAYYTAENIPSKLLYDPAYVHLFMEVNHFKNICDQRTEETARLLDSLQKMLIILNAKDNHIAIQEKRIENLLERVEYVKSSPSSPIKPPQP